MVLHETSNNTQVDRLHFCSSLVTHVQKLIEFWQLKFAKNLFFGTERVNYIMLWLHHVVNLIPREHIMYENTPSN